MAEDNSDASSHASAKDGFKKIWAWITGHPYEAAAIFGYFDCCGVGGASEKR